MKYLLLICFLIISNIEILSQINTKATWTTVVQKDTMYVEQIETNFVIDLQKGTLKVTAKKEDDYKIGDLFSSKMDDMKRTVNSYYITDKTGGKSVLRLYYSTLKSGLTLTYIDMAWSNVTLSYFLNL